jgi:hypothetical protein
MFLHNDLVVGVCKKEIQIFKLEDFKDYIDAKFGEDPEEKVLRPRCIERKWIGDTIVCADVFGTEIIICTKRIRQLQKYSLDGLTCTQTKKI